MNDRLRIATSRRLYDPVEPAIDDRLVLRHIFARAYAEPKGLKTAQSRTPRSELPSLDGMVLVFDCETVEPRPNVRGA